MGHFASAPAGRRDDFIAKPVQILEPKDTENDGSTGAEPKFVENTPGTVFLESQAGQFDHQARLPAPVPCEDQRTGFHGGNGSANRLKGLFQLVRPTQTSMPIKMIGGCARQGLRGRDDVPVVAEMEGSPRRYCSRMKVPCPLTTSSPPPALSVTKSETAALAAV